MLKAINKKIAFVGLALLLMVVLVGQAEETAQDIEEQIDERQEQIEDLEKQIAESENKIKSYQGQERTLKSEITNLNYQEQKLAKNILEKEVLIGSLEKTIGDLEEDLSENISQQEARKDRLAQTLVFIHKFSIQSPLEIMIAENSLADLADVYNTTKRIQETLEAEVKDLKIVEEKTKEIKEQKEVENEKVLEERGLLADQKQIAEKNKSQKSNLLQKTRNQEKYYQQLLTDQQKQMQAFYAEINALEDKLKILIDPASLPEARRGLFEWPVPENGLWITQYYGVTPWRIKYANSTPHRGLDFGVVIGTPMYAVAGGVISGTGDNTKVCEGVQYGKWITVEHENNLSTLYAHLSLIKVNPGDKVEEGDIIGYSGNTGYSTGPHLHFSVFASKGLRIQTIKHSYPGRCYGKEMEIPVVASNAYLDPLGYMPEHDDY